MEYPNYTIEYETKDTTAFFPYALYADGDIITVHPTWDMAAEHKVKLEKAQSIKEQIQVEFITMLNVLKYKYGLTEDQANTEIWNYVQTETDYV